MHYENEVLITGATGIAGSCAVTELTRRNYPLRILVRNIPPEIAYDNNRYVQGDLCQLEQLQEISRANSGIVHYACASLQGKADPSVDVAAMNILLKSWETGPFVFISSLDVYGMPNGSNIIDETHTRYGINDYAKGKIACEELLIQAAKSRGRKDFTIFRAPWIFAPNMASKIHIQRRFLHEFKNAILLPGETQSAWESNIDFWVDARDLAWLVANALTYPLGGAGNVIGGRFNWHDFFTILKSITNLDIPIIHKPRIEVGSYAAELFGQSCIYSGNNVNQHFHFKPRYNLEETLREAFSY